MKSDLGSTQPRINYLGWETAGPALALTLILDVLAAVVHPAEVNAAWACGTASPLTLSNKEASVGITLLRNGLAPSRAQS